MRPLGFLVCPHLSNEVAWALVKVDGSFDAIYHQRAQGIVVHVVSLPALPDIEAKPTRGYWTRGINP